MFASRTTTSQNSGSESVSAADWSPPCSFDLPAGIGSTRAHAHRCARPAWHTAHAMRQAPPSAERARRCDEQCRCRVLRRSSLRNPCKTVRHATLLGVQGMRSACSGGSHSAAELSHSRQRTEGVPVVPRGRGRGFDGRHDLLRLFDEHADLRHAVGRDFDVGEKEPQLVHAERKLRPRRLVPDASMHGEASADETSAGDCSLSSQAGKEFGEAHNWGHGGTQVGA
jgi:hypothetical protein